MGDGIFVISESLRSEADIDFQIKLLGALSVGDVRTGTIPSLLPSQKHYLKEPLAKCSVLAKVKEGEDSNRRNTGRILRIRI